jgi:hypothetical protein
VVVFAKPCLHELEMVLGILDFFGRAYGPMVNYMKSMSIPSRCSTNNIHEIVPSLACPIRHFPCKYTFLPLSLTKLTKVDVQP